MAFRFPLQPLLRLRLSLERRELLCLESLARQIHVVRQQLESLEREKETTERVWRERMQEGSSGAEIHFSVEWQALWRQRWEGLMLRLQELEQQHQQQIVVYQKAQQQRKILENLRRRQEELFLLDQGRREQQGFDELFLLRNFAGPRS